MTWTDRKVAEMCAVKNCPDAPADDNCRCPRHRDDHRARNRAWRLKTRTGEPMRRYVRAMGLAA